MAQSNWISKIKPEDTMGPRSTLAEVAAGNLRDFILLEKLVPGSAISEREMADALEISRTPLREALRMLEVEGLVKYSASRRPFVANPSLSELKKTISVLGALEAFAGETACVQATDIEISEIAQQALNMEQASATLSALDFFQLDMKFHSGVVKASRNEPLIDTHRQYNARLWRARFLSSRQVDRRHTTLSQHAEIAAALGRRDAQTIGQALRTHLESTIVNITRIHERMNAAQPKD